MTLHDRIMRMDTRHLAGDESFWQGVDAARYRAIMIAKEADELMAEMVNTLAGLDPEQLSPCQQDNVCLVLEKYNNWKERTQ